MTQSPSASKVDAVWQRFVGMFGADAVRRRFGDTPPPEWRNSIAQLSEFDLQRGMRRLVHSGKAYVPSLPEFVRACKTVGQDAESGEGKQTNLLPPSEVSITDAWGSKANLHLLAWVYHNARKFESHGRWGRPAVHGEAIATAVRWKNRWADVMRQSAPDEREDGGRDLWRNCMAEAEREIADTLAREAA